MTKALQKVGSISPSFDVAPGASDKRCTELADFACNCPGLLAEDNSLSLPCLRPRFKERLDTPRMCRAVCRSPS